MKKIYLVVFSVVCFTIFSGFKLYERYGIHYSSGPDPGHSGDPASGYQTCAGCHTGAPIRTLQSVITSDIPAEGYVPQTVYTVFVKVKENELTRYGFQISPQNVAGGFLGELIVTDSLTTQLNTQDEHYINHTYAGNGFPGGTGEWSFQWKAPSAGAGEVTFYGAFLLSDFSSSPNGDVVATSTLSAQENTLTGLKSQSMKNTFTLNIFPNPVSEQVRFSLELTKTSHLVVSLLQSDGKVLNSYTFRNLAAQRHDLRLPVSQLSKGLYQLHLNVNGENEVKSFWVE